MRRALAHERQPSEVRTSGFHDLLMLLIGMPVTVVNSESYEEGPVGHLIRPAFYQARAIGMGRDYVILAGKFVHHGAGVANGSTKELILQYLPIARIKRISILATEFLIHI